MKICRVRYGTVDRFAVFAEQEVRLCPAGWQIGDQMVEGDLTEAIPASDADFLVPVRPSKIVCVGRNYAKHAEELNNPLPEEPLLFLKAPSALISEGDPVIIPRQSSRVEHEGELALVIGRECRGLGNDENAEPYILGYLPANDITARDLQKSDVQFARAKSFDTFCPVGRFIETDCEPGDVRVATTVNGEIRQDGRTSEMIFDIQHLIRYISRQMTLNAGDLVLTGTPAGVSKLADGDVCRVEIETVGSVSNPVRSSRTA